MRDKKIFLLFGFIVLVVVLWRISKKAVGVTQLDFDFANIDIDIHNFKDMLKFVGSSKDATVDAVIMNFGHETYEIDNLNIYMYSQSGVTIGYQQEPLQKPVQIKPNQNNHILLPMVLKGAMLVQIGQQLNITKTADLWALVQKYLSTGKFGTSIIIKGFAVVKGIKIPIEFEQKM